MNEGELITWGVVLTVLIISICIATFISGIGQFFMCKKAGVKGAWTSFIPFLNWVSFFPMIKRSRWNILLVFVPFVGAIMPIIWYVDMLKVFDRNGAMVLLILFIPGFSYFYMIYLGVSNKVKYVG